MGTAPLSNYERRDLLLRYIEQTRRVTVGTICGRFQISEATARRDLRVLAKQAKIQRVHGGAISVSPSPQELPVYQRMAELPESKKRMGAAVANLLLDGESVFLGSGTTVLEVARSLTNGRDLTVITNSLLVLNELIDRTSISVISLGGQFRRSELSMIGHMTEQALADLRTDRVVIGIHAISVEDGLSNRHLAETMTDRRILRAGREVIVVADHTKLGRVSTVSVAPLSAIDVLVTDRDAAPDLVEKIERHGVKVILA